MNIDEWFAKIRRKYASQMQCGKGCTLCCHGLFDISAADAVEVANGFAKLPADVQNEVRSKAAQLHDGILKTIAPDPPQPTMFDEDDPRVDAIVDAANSPPCPFLGGAGECLIYEHRPLPCRLEGVPMVDVRDGLFGDWCELNFNEGVSEEALQDLQMDYDALSTDGAVTFIPSVIVEYDAFWRSQS